jgi:tellurite resistance protein TerB|nr:TerB family tellurite resistance protein [Neorhizobium tomejilense]
MALEWLKNNLQAAKQTALTEISKFKNAKFHEAVIAACAKMAYADGIVDPKEKLKMMGFIQNSDVLSVFKVDDSVAHWKKWAGKYENDKDFADMEALQVIAKVKSDTGAARTLLRVAILVANSDNNFDKHEVEAAIQIARELGIDPAEFNLSV